MSRLVGVLGADDRTFLGEGYYIHNFRPPELVVDDDIPSRAGVRRDVRREGRM
jgi:hypothetical protein